MTTIIVAYDEDRAIAKAGKIPWHIKEDFKHFKKTTLGCAVLMGRKTWESLPRKPLPDRTNIVLTSASGYPSSVFTMDNLEEAVWLGGQAKPGKEVFIIGGERVYKDALAAGIVDKVIASHVKGKFDGDQFFPELPDWSGRLVKSYNDFDVYEYIRR